jgi:hypothetical protein
MGTTPASSLPYPEGSGRETPDVYYADLAETADPRLVGFA